MSTVDYNFEIGGLGSPNPLPPRFSAPAPVTRYHRIAEVRQQQGVSVRSVARKLNISMQDVREQEQPTTNLTLAQLLDWQRALEVPLADLLVDSEGPLSAPVDVRARLLRAMKTAKSLAEASHTPATRRLADMLIGQLIDVMPELQEVSPWHSVGQRRTQEEMGRIVERTIPDSLFGDLGS